MAHHHDLVETSVHRGADSERAAGTCMPRSGGRPRHDRWPIPASFSGADIGRCLGLLLVTLLLLTTDAPTAAGESGVEAWRSSMLASRQACGQVTMTGWLVRQFRRYPDSSQPTWNDSVGSLPVDLPEGVWFPHAARSAMGRFSASRRASGLAFGSMTHVLAVGGAGTFPRFHARGLVDARENAGSWSMMSAVAWTEDDAYFEMTPGRSVEGKEVFTLEQKAVRLTTMATVAPDYGTWYSVLAPELPLQVTRVAYSPMPIAADGSVPMPTEDGGTLFVTGDPPRAEGWIVREAAGHYWWVHLSAPAMVAGQQLWTTRRSGEVSLGPLGRQEARAHYRVLDVRECDASDARPRAAALDSVGWTNADLPGKPSIVYEHWRSWDEAKRVEVIAEAKRGQWPSWLDRGTLWEREVTKAPSATPPASDGRHVHELPLGRIGVYIAGGVLVLLGLALLRRKEG